MDEAGVIERSDFPAAQAAEDVSRPTLAFILGGNPSDNLAALMTAEKLSEIGSTAKREYELDKQSRGEFESRYKRAMDLALQTIEAKTFPWPDAANVKFPLLTTAAIQFAARAYPAIVDGKAVVKVKVIGDDPDGAKRDKADRISRHMSYQLIDEMEEWEEDTDRLLHVLPIAGCAFRKTWFDPVKNRNCSEMIPADRLIVDKMAKSIESAPRVTQEFELYPHEVKERIRGGAYIEIELGVSSKGSDDKDAAHLFLEQHRWLDLDEDEFPEPYIVTLHHDTGKVVRIIRRFDPEDVVFNEAQEVVRFTPTQYFTKYGFIPAPDGSFYDLGFGTLLEPINEAVNSTINQMLDAGALANAGGGLIGAGVKMKSGVIQQRPGEWKKVDAVGGALRDGVFPWPSEGPSPVLFQLLGLLIEAGREVASIKDVLMGDTQGKVQTATTTMALIEQGMKVYTSLYKRIHRALKKEFKKLFRLNRLYLQDQQYFTVMDSPEAVARQDYDEKGYDVCPVSDPTVVTDMQRLAKAEFLMQFVADPLFDGMAIRKRMLEAAQIDGIDDLMAKQPPQNPEVIKMAHEAEARTAEVAIQRMQAEAEVVLKYAQALKALADAEATEAGPQMEYYKAHLDILKARMTAGAKGEGKPGGMDGMAGAPGDGGLPPLPARPAAVPDAAMGLGGLPGAGGAGAGAVPGLAGVDGMV